MCVGTATDRYVTTFEDMRNRYEALVEQEKAQATGMGLRSVVGPGVSIGIDVSVDTELRRKRDARELDQDEENYFNTDDDDDEGNNTAKNGSNTINKSSDSEDNIVMQSQHASTAANSMSMATAGGAVGAQRSDGLPLSVEGIERRGVSNTANASSNVQAGTTTTTEDLGLLGAVPIVSADGIRVDNGGEVVQALGGLVDYGSDEDADTNADGDSNNTTTTHTTKGLTAAAAIDRSQDQTKSEQDQQQQGSQHPTPGERSAPVAEGNQAPTAFT